MPNRGRKKRNREVRPLVPADLMGLDRPAVFC